MRTRLEGKSAWKAGELKTEERQEGQRAYKAKKASEKKD